MKQTVTVQLSIVVASPLIVNPVSLALPDGQVGKPYGPVDVLAGLRVSGGKPPYKVSSPNLLAGLTLTQAGSLGGTPTAGSPLDAAGNPTPVSLTINVDDSGTP
jgi:hypothetical protein